MTWYVARCRVDDVTPVGALLRDGWEPFAVSRDLMYLRLESEYDPVLRQGLATGFFVEIIPTAGQFWPQGDAS